MKDEGFSMRSQLVSWRLIRTRKELKRKPYSLVSRDVIGAGDSDSSRVHTLQTFNSFSLQKNSYQSILCINHYLRSLIWILLAGVPLVSNLRLHGIDDRKPLVRW